MRLIYLHLPKRILYNFLFHIRLIFPYPGFLTKFYIWIVVYICRISLLLTSNILGSIINWTYHFYTQITTKASRISFLQSFGSINLTDIFHSLFGKFNKLLKYKHIYWNHCCFWMGRNNLNSGGSSSSLYNRSEK